MDRQIGTSNILETLVKSNFDVKSIENLKDEIYLNFNTKDYDLCIDANIAKNIANYQDIVFVTYCLGKYGTTDTRKLTLDERSRLSLKFKIRKGSTDYLAEVKDIIMMFIESLPEAQRIWGVITISVAITGILGAYLYYRHKESKLIQTTLIQKEETTRLAIEKLAKIAETNTVASHGIEYVMEKEKETVKNFENTDSTIVINGDTYTPETLEKIVKEYSKRIKNETSPVSKNIKGRYVVNNIETKHPYRLTLEDKNNKLIRPTYDPNFLDSDILAEVQRAVSATVPVEFDFDINILTDKNGKDTLSVIKIEKVIYDAK